MGKGNSQTESTTGIRTTISAVPTRGPTSQGRLSAERSSPFLDAAERDASQPKWVSKRDKN